MLYPTELLRLIQKIFNFRLQPDSNELPLRRGLLYPFNYGSISKRRVLVYTISAWVVNPFRGIAKRAGWVYTK